MPFDSQWKLRSLGLGALWGLLYTLILMPFLSLETPIKKIEVKQKEQISKIAISHQISDLDLVGQIHLVVLDSIQESSSLFKTPQDYANLIENLIKLDAKIVLINLPSEVINSPESLALEENDSGSNSIRAVVKKYSNQIVLSSPPDLKRSGPIFEVQSQLIPFNDQNEYAVLPAKIQGFSEFSTPIEELNLAFPAQENDSLIFGSQPISSLLKAYSINPVRYPYSIDGFFRTGDSTTNFNDSTFRSAVCLAADKFADHKTCQKASTLLHPEDYVGYSLWEAEFSSSPATKFCIREAIDKVQALASCGRIDNAHKFVLSGSDDVSNKIVLIDFPKGDPNWSELSTSIRQEPMSPAEMQANVLASVLSGNIQYPLSQEFSLGLTLAGSMLVSGLLGRGLSKSRRWWLACGPLIILGIPLAYALSLPAAFSARVILPICLPILTWVLTGISMTMVLLLKKSREQAAMQRQKLIQREVTLAQTRKVLSRVATDIHDGPLQELKLVMDQVEELETIIDPDLLVVKTSVKSEPIVDKLIRIGQEIRDQLNDLQVISKKQLDISPELLSGLAQGIQSYLKKMEEHGDLRLKITRHIKPLNEPLLNPDWVDAREDIFRFFKEAVNNAIRHAQPPYGQATYLEVRLEQRGQQCILTVENDGVNVLEHTSSTANHQADLLPKGTGTKAMETIAASLTGGDWQRNLSPDGALKVELFWILK